MPDPASGVSLDQIVSQVLRHVEQAEGLDAAHDAGGLIVAGVFSFIIATRGAAVARSAVREIADALSLALAFDEVERTGARN